MGDWAKRKIVCCGDWFKVGQWGYLCCGDWVNGWSGGLCVWVCWLKCRMGGLCVDSRLCWWDCVKWEVG